MANNKTTKGLLGTKLGMTQVWDENNKLVPVTVVEISPNVVTQIRTKDIDGYAGVQIASGAIDPRKVNKPSAGHFEKAGVTPRRHVTELRTADAADYTLGQELTVDGVFVAGTKVDVMGTSKGKGFAGVMKRQTSRVFPLRTVRTATTASRAPSAPPRPPAVSSRACAWPVVWVASA